MKGHTSIVIAHRLSTIKHARRVLVMHKGRVRELGTHEELVREGGIYAKLYQLQYREQENASPSDEPEPSPEPIQEAPSGKKKKRRTRKSPSSTKP